MASGKKGKKTKGKTLALTDFLQETPGSLPTQPIRKSTTSWADEIDDYDSLESKIVNVVLPTAPKASRDYEDIADKVPKEPPFVAYLSNLPYDVDEDEIAEFFKNLKISSMRIPKDDRSGEVPKLKGYGYVEFEDRDSLLSALIIPDTNLKNRRIRIEVATNAENDRRRGGRMGMGDRMGDTGGDWRSSNRPEPIDDRRGGGGSSSGGFSREGMRDSGRDRDYGGFNRERDSGFSRDFGRDRDGFSRNREQDDRPWREGERSNRDNNRDRGFSRPSYRDSDRNRFDRDDRDDRDRRGGGFRRFDDREERNGGITRSNNRDDREDKESEPPSSEPRQRPKLQLAPRTKPLEQASAASAPEPAAPSIFGNAKPVDTTERERQIEEKLRKEQEERLREGSRDRKDRERGTENASDGKNLERGRPILRRDDKDRDLKERDDSSKDRSVSKEDNDRNQNSRTEHRSPENKKQSDKPEKPKREEKRDRPEKDLPKFQEPEPPNFQGSNKFALLDDNSD